MKCAYHPEVEHAAFCIKCGKPLCTQCVRQVQSSIYCADCLATLSAEPPRLNIPPQAIGGSSPEAAFVLGLIPSVGAIYNAEYFKAALHLVVFATLVSLIDRVHGPGQTFLGFLAFGFYVYMPFEAYYTAKKRKLAREGIDLVTPFDQLNDQFGGFGSMELWGGIALVAVGTLFLLDNFGIVTFDSIAQFWPVLLILAGVLFIRRFLRGQQS